MSGEKQSALSGEFAVKDFDCNDDFIKSRIFTIRGVQIVLDRDLAELYGVQTKVLNQAVKRNANRFPPEFMFALAKDETEELVTNCDRFIIVDGKEVFWTGASLKDAGRLTFAAAKMGAEIIPGLLASIRRRHRNAANMAKARRRCVDRARVERVFQQVYKCRQTVKTRLTDISYG